MLKKLIALEEKHCGHVCVMIAGPINYPAAKVFTSKDLYRFSQAIHTYSFAKCSPWGLWWCHDEHDAKKLKGAVQSYFVANDYEHWQDGGVGFYHLPNLAYDVEFAFDHGLRESGVQVFSVEQRNQYLEQGALARKAKLLDTANCRIGGLS